MATQAAMPWSLQQGIPPTARRPYARSPRHYPSSARAVVTRTNSPTLLHIQEREQLVLKLLPLVKWMAVEMGRRLPSSVEVDDLIGAGTLGLMDAVNKFQPQRKVRIESYARHRIRGAILDSLRRMDEVPRRMRTMNKRAERTHRELEARLGRTVNDADMAKALGLSLQAWYRMVRELQTSGIDWMGPAVPKPRIEPDEELKAVEGQASQFDRCYRHEQEEILKQALFALEERERLVMMLHYDQELDFTRIAARLGVSESRISQLHSAAVARMRSWVQTQSARLRPPGGDCLAA